MPSRSSSPRLTRCIAPAPARVHDPAAVSPGAACSILHLEDDQADAELILHTLEVDGIPCRLYQVETRDQFLAALDSLQIDLILADHTLPSFDGLSALRLARGICPDVPFIFLSGTIPPRRAAEAMSEGAMDYVPKKDLARLAPIVRRAMGVARASEARRHPTQELAASASSGDDRARAFFEDSLDGILMVDEHGRVVEANLAAAKALGVPPSDLVGRECSDFIASPGPNQPGGIAGSDLLRRWQDRRVQGVARRGDGTTFPAELAVTRLSGPGPVWRAVVLRDISEQRMVEQEMKKLVAFPRFNPQAVFEFDAAGALTYFNDAALELARQWGQDHPSGILPASVRSTVAECLSAERCLLHQETSAADRVASWSFHPVPGSRVVHAYAVDITERRHLEAQFLRAQRLESIGALASGIAHDLNNILAPILMTVNLLEECPAHPGSARLLETIRASAQRGAEMVKQILSFTRGREAARTAVNLRHLLAELARIASETFPRNIRIRSEAAKRLWTVMADSTQMHQVLMNLCVNARDAMPRGGSLTLEGRNESLAESDPRLPPGQPSGPYLHVSVSDTGTGMTPEVLAQIWEPFFTLKPIEVGTGLGLSTASSIVKAHGGFMRADSQPDQGSTFHVFLPAQPECAVEVLEQMAPILPCGRGELILLVDDEHAYLEIAKAILQKHGYRVLTACDGHAALELFRLEHESVSLVMTDLAMPELDGAATIQALRRIKPLLPVLAVSGLGEEELPPGLSARDVFLRKPFTTERLLSTLAGMLAQPQARTA